jgi:hypothetical protein
VRNVIRWVILAAGLATAAWLLNDFWTNFLLWRATQGTDPSAAELYSDNCLVDGGMIAAAVVVALILFFVLRSDAGGGRGGSR